MCETSELISEIIIQLFRIVIIAEIETHVMLGLANKYRYPDPKGWNELNALANWQFTKNLANYIDIMRDYLGILNWSYLSACDPYNGKWILNENCFELEGIPKAIILRHHLAGCEFHKCDVTNFNESSECYPDYYEERGECSSRLVDCVELGASRTCTSREEPERLLFVNSTELGLLGRNFECPDETGYELDDKMYLDNEHYSCSCDCYEKENKISLALVESSLKDNKIITGLRFVRKDNTLFIQVKEGLLEPNGFIDDSTNGWKPIPDDMDPSEIQSIDQYNRHFFLDDLRLPSSRVLTGIKFSNTTRGNIDGFAIELSGVRFNYSTGEIFAKKKINVFMLSDDPGEPLEFKAINPIESKSPSVASSGDKKYVQLQRSHLYDDFGRTTLPLFDGLPVETDPPSALNGAGIFHKSVDGYAGFISLRLYGLNYDKYLGAFQAAHVKNGEVTFA